MLFRSLDATEQAADTTEPAAAGTTEPAADSTAEPTDRSPDQA